MTKPFHQEKDKNGRRLVSESIAERDDTQKRIAREKKEAVFSVYICSWKILWTEAYRIKDSYGRHPSVQELIQFFKDEDEDVPEDELERRFEISLQSVEKMGLLLRTTGSVDGRVCQVLVNIKNPRTTEAVTDEDFENVKDSEENNKVNLDKI